MPMTIALSCCSTNSQEGSTSNPVTEPPTSSKDPFPVTPGPVDVVIISGQSNAVGCTAAKCLKDSFDRNYYNKCLHGFQGVGIAYDCWTKDVPVGKSPMYYSQNHSKNDNFVRVMLGQGNSTSNFGPEIGIADKLNDTHAGKLFLIKYACGASNLRDDWRDRNSPMYPRFITYVKMQIQNLINKGCTPTIKAFCWMQGEGDAWNEEGLHNKYCENLQVFVGNVREDLAQYNGGHEIPFIDATINNHPGDWPLPEDVNDGKRAFAALSENNYLIDTNANGLDTHQEPTPEQPDKAHYDSASQIKLGKLFAEAFEPFLS